ncbi:hypothetical protein F5879DRAFT_985926 [Lentinula edodes]|nr:hypothetical protein F5879DRAFT_985926 [Lentinula edodes]
MSPPRPRNRLARVSTTASTSPCQHLHYPLRHHHLEIASPASPPPPPPRHHHLKISLPMSPPSTWAPRPRNRLTLSPPPPTPPQHHHHHLRLEIAPPMSPPSTSAPPRNRLARVSTTASTSTPPPQNRLARVSTIHLGTKASKSPHPCLLHHRIHLNTTTTISTLKCPTHVSTMHLGTKAWKSPHLRLHHRLHASFASTSISTSLPPLSFQGHLVRITSFTTPGFHLNITLSEVADANCSARGTGL